MTDEAEEVETFHLVLPPWRVPVEGMPGSPRGAANTALRLGWELQCWMSTGFVDPVLFVGSSEPGVAEPHDAGDIRYAGYQVALYTVEARDAHMGRLGFQAFYEGKQMGKASFSWARVSDPAGLLIELSYDYPPIKTSRGTDSKGRQVETEKSYTKRVQGLVEQSVRLQAEMNGGTRWVTTRHFDKAGGLTKWLAEWQSMRMTK